MTESNLKCIGSIKATVEHKDGRIEVFERKNTVLYLGRVAIAKMLVNFNGDGSGYFVNRWIFGNGGTDSGKTKLVNPDMNALFGATVATKPVISTIDQPNSSQAIFTSVLAYADANGYAINEMALVLNNGDLYSMVTFPDLNKTENIQITFNWYVNLI